MRIVHINASDQRGGAALATRRLHDALRERGVDSRLLVLEKSSDDPDVAALDGLQAEDAVLRVQAGVIQRVYGERNRTDISNTHFSFSTFGIDLSQHPLVRDADVIHLHWIASFQTPATLRALTALGKPIVWTLHDLEPLTGGCHFAAGCSEFRATCAPCAQLRSDPFGVPAATLRDKQRLWSGRELTLVAPSRWIADCARTSAVFRHVRAVSVIPNGVDTRIFRPLPRAEARAAFGLPPTGKYLLAGADHAGEKRKGFAELHRVLRACLDDPNFKSSLRGILWVGEEPPWWQGDGLCLTPLGRIATPERMALAHSAADVFVLPSLDDNLPNMMIEAMSCATPVVAFAVGGIPEVVRDGDCGRVVAPGDLKAMASALRSMLADDVALQAMGKRSRARVEDQFADAVVAERHIELYGKALLAPAGEKFVDAPDGTGNASGHRAAAMAPGKELNELLPRLAAYCWAQERMDQEAHLSRSQDEARRLREEVSRGAQKQVDQEARFSGLREEADRWRSEVESLQRQLRSAVAECQKHVAAIERLQTAVADRLDRERALAARLDFVERDRRALDLRLKRVRWAERLVALRRRSHAPQN